MTITRSLSAPLRSALVAAVLLAGLVGFAVGPLATPAAGHEGAGIFEVEAAHPAGGTAVHYIVRLTWENDGHAATGATVTATPVASDGATLTPVTLAPVDDDGRYQGTIQFPDAGTWTVRFTSIDPTGTAEHTQEITAATATSETTTTTTDDAPGAAAPDDGGDAAVADTDGGGDDGMPLWIIGLAAVVAIGGAASAVGVIRRQRRPASGPTGREPTDDAAP